MEPAHEVAPAAPGELPATPCLPPSPPQPLQQLQLPAIEIPCCSICLAEYAPGIRKPYDLGCGHCVCGRCFASLSMTGPKVRCAVNRIPSCQGTQSGKASWGAVYDCCMCLAHRRARWIARSGCTRMWPTSCCTWWSSSIRSSRNSSSSSSSSSTRTRVRPGAAGRQ